MIKTFVFALINAFIFLGLHADPYTTPASPFVPGTLNEVTTLPTPVHKDFKISGLWDINLDLSDPMVLTSLHNAYFNLNFTDEEAKEMNELATNNDDEADMSQLNSKCAEASENLEEWYACINDDSAVDMVDARGNVGGGGGSGFFFGLSGFGNISGSTGSSAGASSGNGGGGDIADGTPPPPVTTPGLPVPEPLTIIILGGMVGAGAYLKNRKSSE